METTQQLPGLADKQWQMMFVAYLPTIRKYLRLAFRHLVKDQREEAIQEAMACVCAALERLAAQDRLNVAYPTVLARFAILHVFVGRTIGTRSNSREVLSPYAQRKRQFCVERLDRFDSGSRRWREAVIEDYQTPIPDQVSFRIDFPNWLATLSKRQRELAEDLANGGTTREMANRFSITPGRVSQLRREFHDSWQRFHGNENASALAMTG